MADSNSLGLDLTATATEQGGETVEQESKAEKKKPYVNPERVKTGGPQREKPSEEELAERMQRIKEQNEKIKQRRQDVKADEDAFRKMQEAERVKQAQTRKVQEGVDRTREQNARRKMEKMGSREWDSGKTTGGRGRGGTRGRGNWGRGRGGGTATTATTTVAAVAGTAAGSGETGPTSV